MLKVQPFLSPLARIALPFILLVVCGINTAFALHLVSGQSVYVPAYSEIPYGSGEATIPLSATLTVSNVDTSRPIAVKRVDYYDSKGTRVRGYLNAPRWLGPLATLEIMVPTSDRSGGISANFVVEWSAKEPVPPPVIESVMIGTASKQGISLVGKSRVISEVP